MRRRRVVLTLVLAAAAACGACNGTSGSLTAGDECHSSSECGTGLVCDFNQTPAVCAGNLSPLPEAGPEPDAPEVEADAGIDAAPQPDAPPGTPDAAPVDASPPDAPPKPDAAVPDAALPDAA
jgi:hypothetical protein